MKKPPQKHTVLYSTYHAIKVNNPTCTKIVMILLCLDQSLDSITMD